MLLFEELALVAVNPESGRHALGVREPLNASLAGLLVAELLLEGIAEPAPDRDDAVVLTDRPAPASAVLAAVARVVADRGPKIKAILSHMNRGLEKQLGTGTWSSAVAGLADAGVLAPASGALRPQRNLLDPAARDAVVERLRAAAGHDDPLDPRTAVLLSMTGPAWLLEVVAPERRTRRHARQRIDHALDSTDLQAVGKIVRRVIAEAETMAGAMVATTVVASGT
ncbi:MAG: GPP34 family phosphoprotein [Acidimicrobiia bacterium]